LIKNTLRETDFIKSHINEEDSQNPEIEQNDEYSELFIYEILEGKAEIGFTGIY
jgi:hypothetical protein